jgi:hypothetical protein
MEGTMKDKCRDCKFYFKNITLSSPATWGGWYRGDIGNCHKKSSRFAVYASQAICRDFSRPLLEKDLIKSIIPEKKSVQDGQGVVTYIPSIKINVKKTLFQKIFG